jgi:hypothetical protein
MYGSAICLASGCRKEKVAFRPVSLEYGVNV